MENISLKVNILKKLILLLLIIISILRNINCTYKEKYNKLLQKNYKSDIELNFNPEFNFYKNLTENNSIRKYYHNYKENEINMMNGAKMKCYIPRKIKKNVEDNSTKIYLNENLTDELASIFLRESSKICYNSNFKEWYYKLCPLKSTSQVLSYKKKDETGEEYTENWSIGFREELKKFNLLDKYQLETNDTSSTNLEKNAFVVTEGRVAKIYNYDLSSLKKYELSLLIDYDLSELKNLNKTVIINRYTKSLEEYLKNSPDAKKIPVQRKIVKLVNKHLVILDGEFPIPKMTENFHLNLIKERTTNDINHSFNLVVYGDLVFCYRCEFLTSYNIGDSFFIKNGKYSLAHRSSFKSDAYKSRKIVHIYDNQLLKVDKNYPKDYQGTVIRNFYFVFASMNRTFSWINGKGIIRPKGKLLIGTNSKFIKQLQKGDRLVFYNPQNVHETFNLVNTNPRIIINNDNSCIVEKILTNNLLITVTPCLKPFMHKGEFYIGKTFYEYDESFYKVDTDKYKSKRIMSIVDFHTIETLDIAKKHHNFYNGNYLFHPGFLITKPNDTVLRMKLEKINSNKTFLRILFGTDLKYYNSPASHDYELLINSETGTMIKRVMNKESNDNSLNIEFYDTEIRSFFQESILIDIVLYNNAIFLNTMDDDKEFSIKLMYNLPKNETIKYIYFDIYNSDNVQIRDIRKINFVEQKYLLSIFAFNKKLQLKPDAFYVEVMANGDYCPPISGYRKSIVEYRCDPSGTFDLTIENVSEERMCQYKYLVKTRHLCNPIQLMLNKIDRSIAKTQCVIANNNYNEKEEVYYRNT